MKIVVLAGGISTERDVSLCSGRNIYEALKENGLPEETNLAGYVSIIREIAEFYGLPVLDLFSTSGLQPKVDIIKETYMPDGLHPSDAGALRIARRLIGFLQTL